MFHFIMGSGQGKVSDEIGNKIDAIAKKHGANFTWVKLPEGYRHWFTCRNYGHPFDEAVASAVRADVHAAQMELP